MEDQFEISFSIPRGTLLWQPNFVGFTCMGVDGSRRLVAQPGGLTLGFALRLV